jgi:hypothetical protein
MPGCRGLRRNLRAWNDARCQLIEFPNMERPTTSRVLCEKCEAPAVCGERQHRTGAQIVERRLGCDEEACERKRSRL